MKIFTGEEITAGMYDDLFTLTQCSLPLSRSFLQGLSDVNNSIRSVVAVDGLEVVGGAIGQFSAHYDINNCMCLSTIVVSEDYRGKGVGSKVLDAFESHHRNLKLSGIELDTKCPSWFSERGYSIDDCFSGHAYMSKSFS